MSKDTRQTPSAVFKWRHGIAESPRPPKGLTSTQRLVAHTLRLFVDLDSLETYVGPARLSRATGLHLVTVKKTMAELEDACWLALIERGGSPASGRRTANLYRLATPTSSSGLPVVEDDRLSWIHRPVVEVAPTGRPGLPHQEEITYRSRRQKLSPAEYALRCSDSRFEDTVAERASEVFDDDADVLAVVTAWRAQQTNSSKQPENSGAYR